MSPAGVVDAVVDLLLLWGKFMLEKKKKKKKKNKVLQSTRRRMV